MNTIRAVKNLLILGLILAYACFPPFLTLPPPLRSRVWIGTGLLIAISYLGITGWRMKRGESIVRPPLDLTTLFFIVSSTMITLNAIQDLPAMTDATTVYSAHLGPIYESIHYILVLWIMIYRLKGGGIETGLVPVLVYSTMNGHLFNQSYTLLLALGLIITMDWLAEGGKGRKLRLVKSPLHLPVLILLAFGVISTAKAVYVYESLQRLVRLGNWALVYFLLVHCIEERRQVGLMLSTLLIMAGVTAVTGILGVLNYAIEAGMMHALTAQLWLVELYPNGSATYLAPMTIMAIGAGLAVTSKAQRALLIVLTSSLLLCLAMTFSRAGWLALFCGIAVMVSLNPLSTSPRLSRVLGQRRIITRRSGKLLLVLAVLLLFAVILLWPRLTPLIQMAGQRLLATDPLVTRSVLWRVSLDIIAHHPVLGIGIGNRLVYPEYTQGLTDDQMDIVMGPVILYGSHNLFLEIGEMIGLLGLGAFIWLFITLARYGLSQFRRTADHCHRWLLLGLLAGEVALLTALMFGLSLASRTLLPFTFWAFMGLIGAIGRIQSRGENAAGAAVSRVEVEITNAWPRTILAGFVVAAGLLFVVRPLVAGWHCERAMEHAEEEDIDQAISNLAVAKRLEPLNARHLTSAGEIYIDAGSIGRALAEYQRASELYPDYYGYRTKLGWLYWHENMFERALGEFEKAVELNPIGATNGQVLADLAVAYAAAGSHQAAVDTFKRAFRHEYYDPDVGAIWQAVEANDGRIVTILDRSFTDYDQQGNVDEELKKRILHHLDSRAYPIASFGFRGLDDTSPDILFMDTILQELHDDYRRLLGVDSKTGRRGLLKLAQIYRGRQLDDGADQVLAELHDIVETGAMTEQEQARFHFQLGRIYLDRGKPDKALEELQNVTSTQVAPDLHYWRGLAHWEKEMVEEAIANLEAFVTERLEGRSGLQFHRMEVESQLASGYDLLADAYLLQGELDKSLSARRKAAFFGRHSVASFIKIGELYQQQGKYEKAIKEYLRPLKLFAPDQQLGWGLETFVDLAHHSSEAYRAQGMTAPEAMAHHEVMLQAQMEEAAAQVYLGLFYAEQGRLDKATDAHQRAVTIAPQSILAHLILGNDYAQAGEVEEAVDAYQRAADLGIRRREVAGHLALGRLYCSLGMMDAAIAEFEKAIEIRPGRVYSYLFLADIYTSQKKPEKALREHQRATRANTLSVPARLALANVYQNRGMIDEAIAEYAKIVRLDPDNESHRLTLCELCQHPDVKNEASHCPAFCSPD